MSPAGAWAEHRKVGAQEERGARQQPPLPALKCSWCVSNYFNTHKPSQQLHSGSCWATSSVQAKGERSGQNGQRLKTKNSHQGIGWSRGRWREWPFSVTPRVSSARFVNAQDRRVQSSRARTGTVLFTEFWRK